MCVGAGLAGFGLILNLIGSDGLVVGYSAASPRTDALGMVDAAGSTIGSFAGIVLWLWMAAANNAGRRWARVTATVFFVINTVDLAALLFALRAFSHHASVFGGSLSKVAHVVVPEAVGTWVLGLAIIVLLWSGASSEYYAAMRGFDY